MKSWSFREMETFIVKNRPRKRVLAYTYVFHNISQMDPDQVLAEFDKWVIDTRRTWFNEIKNSVGQILVSLGNKLAKGMTDRQIAVEMGLKHTTIEGYIREILAKLGAINRANAVFLYFCKEEM